MSIEENKALARRWYAEVWNEPDLGHVMQAVEELHIAELVDHNPLQGQPPGIDGLKYMVGGLRQSYPDMRFDIDLLLAENDKVVGRWTMYATNTKPLLIAGGIPPTGKAVKITGMDILRIADGKIVEMWHQEDVMSMMQQLGLAPS